MWICPDRSRAGSVRGLMSTAHAATIANDTPFCESQRDMKKLEDALSSDEALHAPLHDIERMLEAQGREMLRAMMQAHFDLRSRPRRQKK